ncbi:MAG: hypothetical protein LDL44_12440 [Caenispirillum sp.]|nr:hypothetical protein [Caenispirillum sp.]
MTTTTLPLASPPARSGGYALTLDDVRALKPCANGLRKARNVIGDRWASAAVDAAAAMSAGISSDYVLWVAAHLPHCRPRLAQWAADCAARVLTIHEARQLRCSLCRDAIAAVRSGSRLRAGLIYSRSYGVCDGSDHPAVYAAFIAFNDVARGVLGAAKSARNIAANTYTGDAYTAERAWQAQRLGLWLSEAPPEPIPLNQKGTA